MIVPRPSTATARLALAMAVVLLTAIGANKVCAAEEEAGLAWFEKKIRPVLIQKCYECHSSEAASHGRLKAGLRLDTRAGLLAGGASGPAIVPGKPDESLLLSALRYNGLEMPPEERLSAAVIADFEKWIALGAPDSRDGAAAPVQRGMSIEDGRRFWSFVPPQTPQLPRVHHASWPREEMDRYVLAGLEKQGLQPAPEATARTLIRRLYFDLIGLPPEPAQVEAFVDRYTPGNDSHAAVEKNRSSGNEPSAEQAYAELVDELLASPHFGERWGRHWLDVARYADSNGRDRNVFFYHAWRYRDYVIGAFNKDKPFDVFVREQVAGDLLPADSIATRDKQRIATGFLALGAKAFEERNPEIFRMDVIDEQIELVSRAILGISVGCARCHDHKFDPIPTADYYALAGIFRSTQPLYGYGPKGIQATQHAHSGLYPIGGQADLLGAAGLKYLATLDELTLAQNKARSDRYRVVRSLSAKKLELAKPAADTATLELEVARLEADIKDWDGKVAAAETALQAAIDGAPAQPDWAMGVMEHEQVEDCRIHIRGDTNNLGPVVSRGMLQVVTCTSATKVDRSGSGRFELAQWLTRRDNPLTARVFVNRVWLHLFGRGIVTTPDDYGVNGARPSHPDLLDHLAVRFMDDDWSVKRLIRSIVTSSTYRQGSNVGASAPQVSLGSDSADAEALDPDNIHLSYMKPRRLEAEAFRDAMMSVAGTLETSPPAPEQEFLAKFNMYREDEYRTFKPIFTAKEIDGPRRSVYLPVIRGVLPEIFQLFDFAPPDRSVPQREESTVPAQSLYLMNNPWVVEQSRRTARRMLDDAACRDDAARVRLLYQRAYGRLPTSTELQRATAYLAEPELLIATPAATQPLSAQQLQEHRWTSFCQAVFASAEFRIVP